MMSESLEQVKLTKEDFTDDVLYVLKHWTREPMDTEKWEEEMKWVFEKYVYKNQQIVENIEKLEINIKEEGGCELYNIYINGKLWQDGLSSENIITGKELMKV